MKSVLVIGGGFAGLAAAIELTKSGLADVELIDQNEHFLDLLSLHKTHSVSLESLRIPYHKLASRFGFRFEKLCLSDSELHSLLAKPENSQNQNRGALQIRKKNYDYVVLATGSQSLHFRKIQQKNFRSFVSLEMLKEHELHSFLPPKESSANNGAFDGGGRKEPFRIGIIGGGATGVQYAFELAAFLKKKRIFHSIQLFSSETSLLPAFPAEFGAYAHRAADKAGIEIHYMTLVKEVQKQGLLVKRPDGKQKTHLLDLMFNFAGIAGKPCRFSCSPFGEIFEKGRALPGLYAAGDNSHFAGAGLNSATAQAANRKGRAVADAIVSHIRGRKPKPYSYEALGYFVSLGPKDGIGWMLDRAVIATGLPAYAMKETIEKQFRLYLEGFDTYL